MADKLRSINTHFWDDNYIVKLDPIEKLLFLYFLSNPLTNIAGVYEITLRRVAFDTGIDAEMVKKMLDRFGQDGKVLYFDGWLILKNFIKNQHLSEKALIGANKIISCLPENIRIAYDSLSKPMLKVQTWSKQLESENEIESERESESQMQKMGVCDDFGIPLSESQPDPLSGLPEAVVVLWNETFPEKQCRSTTQQIREGVKICINIQPEFSELTKWRELLGVCRESDFLMNRLADWFSLSWLVSPVNFKKIACEGKMVGGSGLKAAPTVASMRESILAQQEIFKAQKEKILGRRSATV